MNIGLHYNDVILTPNYSTCRSRGDVDLRSTPKFLGIDFKSVCIPANMKCVIDFNLAEKLSENNYFYILHRFYKYSEILEWIDKSQKLKLISISVGVKDEDKRFIDELRKERPKGIDCITIDVANGHNILVKQMIEYIRGINFNFISPCRTFGFKYQPKIIAGNVCTKQAVEDLRFWGADCAKVGISMGGACSTYNTTGVGSPMYTTIQECSKGGIPIIADGGIREPQDVCKALHAGADMVMIGKNFVACNDSPAEIHEDVDGKFKKVYYGSASATNKGHDNYVEGRESVLVELNGLTYINYMQKLNEAIRSSMSYAGVYTLRDYKNSMIANIHHLK